MMQSATVDAIESRYKTKEERKKQKYGAKKRLLTQKKNAVELAQNRLAETQAILSNKKSKIEKKIEKHPAYANVKAMRERERALAKELNKYGIWDGIAIDSMVDTAPVTARQMLSDIERARDNMEWREKAINSLFEKSKDGKVNRTDVEWALARAFVRKRIGKKQRLTREDVDKLLGEYKAMSLMYAGSEGGMIQDLEMADSQSLEEMERIQQARDNGILIEDASSDTLIVRSLTKEEEIRNSTPGVVPEENKAANNISSIAASSV